MPRKNYIQIKASDQEKASWLAQAYLEGKNLSNFIRDRLNAPESPAEAINQHNKLLDQIKEKMNGQ